VNCFQLGKAMQADTSVRRRWLLACACGLLLLSGCSSKAELVKFNDRIAQLFKRLGEADRAFSRGVEDFAYGRGLVDVAFKRFHDGYDRLREATAEVAKEAGALQVPDTPDARAFYDRFRDVIKVHEEIVEKFREARNATEKGARGARDRLRKMYEEAQRRKEPAWLVLDAAQEAFARANRIKLK
jgi:hypothetical protein